MKQWEGFWAQFWQQADERIDQQFQRQAQVKSKKSKQTLAKKPSPRPTGVKVRTKGQFKKLKIF
jgi:hypothetical protein